MLVEQVDDGKINKRKTPGETNQAFFKICRALTRRKEHKHEQSTTGARQVQVRFILSRFEELRAEGTLPIFKFEQPRHAILAKLLGRRRDVKTKKGTSTVLDVETSRIITVTSWGNSPSSRAPT